MGLPHQHNVIMTSFSAVLQRNAGSELANRMAAMLAGMGILHFVAPKPFDGIVPVRRGGPAGAGLTVSPRGAPESLDAFLEEVRRLGGR